MPRNLALPHPPISAQLYIAIVLTVAVLCGLTGVSIKFAGETIAAAQRIHARGLEPIVLLARAEVPLKRTGGSNASTPPKRALTGSGTRRASRSLWIFAGAGIAGVLIGPLGLF